VAAEGKRPDTERRFFLVPVGNLTAHSVEQTLRLLLDRGYYVFSDRTKGLKGLRPDDQICLYETGAGVVAEATASGPPENRVPDFVPDASRFRWSVHVERVRYFFSDPVAINADLRARLDAFRGKDPNRAWAWFVQGAKPVTRHDFELLTRSTTEAEPRRIG
jgi:hypothetical protein